MKIALWQDRKGVFLGLLTESKLLLLVFIKGEGGERASAHQTFARSIAGQRLC